MRFLGSVPLKSYGTLYSYISDTNVWYIYVTLSTHDEILLITCHSQKQYEQKLAILQMEKSVKKIKEIVEIKKVYDTKVRKFGDWLSKWKVS